MLSSLQLDMSTICALGVLLAFAGLVGLLLGVGRKGPLAGLGEVAVLTVPAILGGAGWSMGLDPFIWLPCLGVSACGLILLFLRFVPFAWFGRAAQSFLGRPVFLWGGLFLAGVGTLVTQQILLQRELAPDFVVDFEEEGFSPEQLLQPVETQFAATDSGKPVPLFTIPTENQGTINPKSEMNLLERQKLGLANIRTDEMSLAYNCHGFVFTGGRFWVRGVWVNQILQDNGYRETSQPRPGDVAVYRSVETDEVIHTGLVRTVLDDMILIESKFGSLGRFIHTADKHPYQGSKLTYYHTRRNGHMLSGLEGTRRPYGTIAAE